MPNLRILGINSADSRTIKAKFSEPLSPNISEQNILVTTDANGVPNPAIVSLDIRDNILTIKTLPVTPYVKYYVTFKSTDAVRFSDITGAYVVLEDGRTNVLPVIGAENPNDEIRDNLVDFLKENVYNLSRETKVRAVLNALSSQLSKARFDIKQAKSDNYLTVLIENEQKTRGFGPFDRLNEEGAYEVIRVGITEQDANLPTNLFYNSFPSEIITLQSVTVTNAELEGGTGPGTFNGLVLTVRSSPVTKLTGVTINYQSGDSYTYDIRSLGYRINSSRYDSVFGSTLLTLEDNQFGLNEEILDDPTFEKPGAGDTILVSYEFKSEGRIIDDVTVTQKLNAVREPADAFTTQFSTDFAPIVNANNLVSTSKGIEFLDPYSTTPFQNTHPAFVKEISFSLSGLPRNPGEYSVDYETGRVFVFGAVKNDGTGAFPPAMNYTHRNTFISNLDYTYNPATYELAASPIRELAGQTAQINYNFEQTLIPNVDFVGDTHVEIINERIQNRLDNTGALKTTKSPITNVFRVFNETISEEYQLNRFDRDTVYFTANGQAPNISQNKRERGSFTTVSNELLLLDSEFINTNSVRVYALRLSNQNVISNTEDVVGSSYNTSASFSRSDIFNLELFFDGQELTIAQNTNRLEVGQFQIDYRNGFVYVGVESLQDFDVGTITYKKPVVKPNHPHVLSVSNIFYSISELQGISKQLNYSGFEDNAIFPNEFDVSDERFLNGDTTLSYFVNSGKIQVSDDIKSVRHIFDAFDLNNSDEPTDFSPSATSAANIITLDTTGIEKREAITVGPGLTVTVTTTSPGISLAKANSIVRVTDNQQLLDGYQTIAGNTITLAVSSGAIVGDIVDVIYTVQLNGGATPIVDYNRGDYFINYAYLLDEILVSYEYGDNVIDWRASDVLSPGDQYFVTYRIGALRDSLLGNFGGLVTIPEVQAFDQDLPRESYRDILIGALQSFTKGPTIPAIKLLVSSITKIDPQIIESAFDVWSLGYSYLFPEPVKCPGDPQLTVGVFDQGLRIDQPEQAVTFPVSSNLRLNEGTLEMWVIPDWDGLDNDATLTFKNIRRDGYAVSSNQIFIGSSSFNPTFDDKGTFSINRLDGISPIGLPSSIFTATGLFIYYNPDEKRWNMLVKDAPDGYDGYTWSGSIDTSGQYYDVKFIENLGELNDIVRSGFANIEWEFHLDGYDAASPDGYSTHDGYIPGFSFDGISFMSDDLHYLFDFAETSSTNRFSLYKDGRGYLNFEVWDKGNGYAQKPGRRSSRVVSADIQDWESGIKHQVAIAWKINTSERQDEMHIFIDGFEIPNIIVYGGQPTVAITNRFRTIVPELVVGTVTKKAIAGNDLRTTQGSNIVTSDSVDFSIEGILIGDTIQILEQGFNAYTITLVSGSSLTLSSNMPATLSNARFTVNPFSAVVGTEIDLYKNIIVSKITLAGDEIEIPGQRATIPGYRIQRNMLNQRVLQVTGDVNPGDRINIRTLGLNYQRCREDVYLWNDQAVLKTSLPPPINLDDVYIRSVTLPLVPIGPDNATLILGNWVASLQAVTQTSATEGRQLTMRVTGGNVDFTTPTSITLNGTSTVGITETLLFTAPGELTTVGKWITITSIDVVTTPIVPSRTGLSVEIKETYSVTFPNGNSAYPVIRFAYKTQTGLTLEGDGSAIVSDPDGFFMNSDVGNLIEITSPPAVAGTYQIDEKIDSTTIRLDSATGSVFSAGSYGIFDITIARSGFQNGFFFLERAGFNNTPYPLPLGYYEFDYTTFLEIPFNPIGQTAYIGNSFQLNAPAKAVIDEFRILKTISTDTRVGETIGINERSITTDFQQIGPFAPSNDALMLLHFDVLPPENDAPFIVFAEKEFVQSSTSVNARFGQSIVMSNKGLQFENQNRLNTRDQGLIEFWVSPKFDTYNDPEIRTYFDAAANIAEDLTSLTKATVQTAGQVARVLYVRLVDDTDENGTNFFTGGSISNDGRTINLGTPLPFQNTIVKIAYVPSGIQGDRIHIFKDEAGYITYNVQASGQLYQLRQPIFWARDTWHRVRASFKFNTKDNFDEIRLFIDGEERNIIRFGDGLMFGEGFIYGQNSVAVGANGFVGDINFLDTITQFSIGQDFAGFNTAYARMDNFKLSNVDYLPLNVAGQPVDVYWNTNSSVLYPSIEDGYTTFLLDFESLEKKVDDFAILRDPSFGIFNFVLNVIDSFDIVSKDARVNQVLTAMILALKPANSSVDINIIK